MTQPPDITCPADIPHEGITFLEITQAAIPGSDSVVVQGIYCLDEDPERKLYFYVPMGEAYDDIMPEFQQLLWKDWITAIRAAHEVENATP